MRYAELSAAQTVTGLEGFMTPKAPGYPLVGGRGTTHHPDHRSEASIFFGRPPSLVSIHPPLVVKLRLKAVTTLRCQLYYLPTKYSLLSKRGWANFWRKMKYVDAT